jgi:hypothetical protein
VDSRRFSLSTALRLDGYLKPYLNALIVFNFERSRLRNKMLILSSVESAVEAFSKKA